MENSTLISRKNIATGLFIIRVRPDGGVPDFIPGQYVAMGVRNTEATAGETGESSKFIKRAYSIASSPDDKDALEFYIALVDDGLLTPHLEHLAPGDRLYVSPKITGTFTLENIPAGKHVLLISTGTGIAPYVSMLRSRKCLELENTFTLIHGVRYETDLAYRDELEELARTSEKLNYFNTVSRATEAWTGERGYVGKFLKDGTVNCEPENSHVFLCGNPAMIDEIEELLVQRGFSVHSKKHPGNIHHEKYW